MAFVAVGNGSGYWFTVTLVDSQNDQSTLEYELVAASWNDAVTAADALLLDIQAVTNSVVSRTALSLRLENDSFAYPATAANNSEKARIVVQLDGSTKKAVLDIPAPKNSIFVSPSGAQNNIVNLTETPVVNYLQNFQTGGTAFISDGELSAFGIRGERVTSRKGMSRG